MRSAVRPWLARVLILAGAVALAWVSFDRLSATWYQAQLNVVLEGMRHAPEVETSSAPARLEIGEPIGTLEIARLGLSGVVVEGDDDSVLDRAIGHLPDTPLPWHEGNSAIAAHRDEIFRPLKDVRIGDVLRLETPHGDFDYRVRETLIVKPTDLWVLDSTPESMLTLISCYPFNFIGNAPERFIVRAERVTRTAPVARTGT